MADIFSEALEKAHTREGILGSISESKQDFLEKGKRAQVGEIREWKGQKFQKQPNGGWLPVKGEKKSEKSVEEKQDKGETKPTASSFFGDIMKEVGWNSNEYKIDREGDKYINIRFTTEKRPTSNDLVKTLGAIEKTIKDKNLRLDMAPFGDFTGKNPYIYIQLHNKNAFAEEKSEKKKDTHGVEKKVLDFLAVSSNKYNDISKVSIYKTPKGNWVLQYDGNDVSVVGGNTLPEADLKAAGLLEEEEETETEKEEVEMPSEKDFFRATGLKYNHPVEDYQVSLAILNEVPDDHKMWTGKTAGEMKELLTKQITKLGGSTDVGTMKDWFIDE